VDRQPLDLPIDYPPSGVPIRCENQPRYCGGIGVPLNASWQAREPTGLRRIVLILNTTLLEEYQNRKHRPTIEMRVIAYVNQKLKNSNPNDSEPWLVPS
jgi:hypothetical protein